MPLFWVAIITFAVLVARALFALSRQSHRDVAVDLLTRRFAAREISQAEVRASPEYAG